MKYIWPHRRNHQEAGFALIVTLLLIAIAGVAMGVVARQSLALASRAELDQARLQHDWGTRSIQTTLLPNVLDVLAAAETQSETPLVSYHTSIELNGTLFDLIFGDEQAKTNINTLIGGHSELEALDTLTELIEDRRAMESLLLDPLPNVSNVDEGSDAFEKRVADQRADGRGKAKADHEEGLPRTSPIASFEQVWPELTVEQLINLNNPDQSWTAQLTLWGDGRVHFQRASAESIYRAVEEHLLRRDVLHLVALRDATPALGIDRALHDYDPELERGVQHLIANGLTEQSNCQSLWVIAETQRRKRYHLAIILKESSQSSATKASITPSVFRMNW